MALPLTLLETPAQLDSAVEASFSRPVLIFKHSLTCGRSAWAYREFEALVQASQARAEAFLVHVQTARPVSTAIAERLGVRHESPQALLVVDGVVRWHASHGGLTRAAMTTAIEGLAVQASSSRG